MARLTDFHRQQRTIDINLLPAVENPDSDALIAVSDI
jgi:hypothetical protein